MVEVEWSTIEVFLLLLLVAMIVSSFALICYSGNLGCYIFVPSKHYSRLGFVASSASGESKEVPSSIRVEDNVRMSNG